ncbi:hypothetical protein BpHYR1_045865 [Brachionus plicatilis]|uniref:Uncharacterized protein n=1 Tax=Brachionus plicatilis TaxID=10195 RepID=A0A3M7PR15_BRAPC|nr:hypothetical protein BpHYR1_045865 [Brachionus plicatilis]
MSYIRIFYKTDLFINLLTRNIHYLDITSLSSIDNILSTPTVSFLICHDCRKILKEIRIPEIPGLTEERYTVFGMLIMQVCWDEKWFLSQSSPPHP